MITVVTKVQGNSIVVELPSNNGIKLNINQEYIVVYTQDGTIILVPASEGPFLEMGTA